MRAFYRTLAGLFCGACLDRALIRAGLQRESATRVPDHEVKPGDRCQTCGAGQYSGI